MDKTKAKIKTPEKINFSMSPVVADKFRNYCTKNQYVMGKLLEELVIEHLIKEGIISSWVALGNEQMEKGEKV